MQVGTNIIICDAGGSTVDTTVYNVTKNNPMLKLNEVKSSACEEKKIKNQKRKHSQNQDGWHKISKKQLFLWKKRRKYKFYVKLL